MVLKIPKLETIGESKELEKKHDENPSTDLDKSLLEKANENKEQFMTDMVKYSCIYATDESNDYSLFLYLASIINYCEYHNGGCLTELGMKSLSLDISPFIKQIQDGNKLEQKDLVRFLLNLINSYAVSVLSRGLFECCKELTPEHFFRVNEFPQNIRDDFENLERKCDDIIPKLKQILDVFSNNLEGKYKRIFLEEKTKGFKKPIFKAEAVKIQTNKFFQNELANAKECK